MVAKALPFDGVHVIVVPDDNAQAVNVPDGILQQLGPQTVLMSNDSLRMYVRHTHWESLKESYLLTNPGLIVEPERTRFEG
jgi:hypothetical protein